jgi:AcrR family transcriptional regulator
VRRTRRQLRDALVGLILDKGWDAVSVLDVCERADVGRSTFYVHFADKEDLLLSGFDELHATLDVRGAEPGRAFGFAEALIAHAAENQRLFRALIGRQSGQRVQARFRDVVTHMIEEELATRKHAKAGRPTTARFLTGGLLELLMTWLDRPGKVTGDELAAQFRSLAMAALRW